MSELADAVSLKDPGVPLAASSTPPAAVQSAWSAVISLAFGTFGIVAAEFLPISLLTPIANDLRIPVGLAGQSVAVTAVTAAIAGPTVVVVARNIDRRNIIVALSCLLIVSNMLAAFAQSAFMLFAARIALGASLGGFYAVAAALSLRLVPPHRVARATAVIYGGISLATVCAAPLSAFLGALFGWRVTFMVSGAFSVFALILQLMTLPSLPASTAMRLNSFGTVLKRPAIRVGVLSCIFIMAGNFSGFTYVRPFLETVTRMNVNEISVILLLFGVGGFVGNFLGGFLAERSLRWAVTANGAVFAMAAFTLCVLGEQWMPTALAVTAWGLALGGFPVTIQSWILGSARDHAETAGALIVVTIQGSIAVGAIIGGVLMSMTGSFGPVALASLFGLLGAVTIGWFGLGHEPS